MPKPRKQPEPEPITPAEIGAETISQLETIDAELASAKPDFGFIRQIIIGLKNDLAQLLEKPSTESDGE